MRSSLIAAAVALAFAAVAVAATWPGPPTTKPPKLKQPGPPAAWIETPIRARWLAYSTYCWKTICVDFLPAASRTDLPVVHGQKNQPVRIHFSFLPRDARVTLISAHAGKRFTLKAARVVEWKPATSGVAVIEVHAAGGSASYAARLALS